MTNQERTKVVLLYDEHDIVHAKRLHVHLASFVRIGAIEVWDKTMIAPGTVLEQELHHALLSAKVVILLVSADFLASTFMENELPMLLLAQKKERASIISIIIGPCSFHQTSLAAFQYVNTPSGPLMQMNTYEKERTWTQVAAFVAHALSSVRLEAKVTAILPLIQLYSPDTMGTSLLSLQQKGKANHDALPHTSQLLHVSAYYSVFISYSIEDEEFAQRLTTDLQYRGVLCWFAPHNLRIGDKPRVRVDELIFMQEKVLLILSRHSVKSSWVEKEVATAFDKEEEEKCLVLFPIMIDRAIWQEKAGWAADIRRQRYIGDFTHWSEENGYHRALERLVRDLKIDGS